MQVCTLTKVYKTNKYNLSLTANVLSKLPNDMKSKRNVNEMPSENIPLLQEIAFVKNKEQILNHLETLKTEEEQLFKDLKVLSSFFSIYQNKIYLLGPYIFDSRIKIYS